MAAFTMWSTTPTATTAPSNPAAIWRRTVSAGKELQMQYIVLPVVQFLILLIALSQFLILPIALLQFLILGIAALVLLVLFVRCCTIVAILAMISFRMAVKAFLFIAIWLFISIMVRFGFVGVIAASPIDGKAGALWLLLGTLIGSIILSGFYFDFYYDLIALARRQPYEKSEQR